MDFNFEQEMVYGKKHVNILDGFGNDNDYDFRPYARECFNIENLDETHTLGYKYDLFKEFGIDTQTWYHNTFYNYLKGTKGSEMQALYEKMIKKIILPYLGLNEALVQTFPSFRIQLPENIAVAKKHHDHSLGHPIGEINFTYSFTKMYDTNTIWIEKMPRMEEYVPIIMKENQVCSFNANLCNHYNKLNKTGKTRMSMDFRILPLNYYNENNVKTSCSINTKFCDGGYYKLIKI